MSDKPAAGNAPAKSGGINKIMLIVVALASLGGGAAMPMLTAKSKTTEDDSHGETKKKKSAHADLPVANVPFGDVVVNLADDRMSRFLRLKIILKIEGIAEEKGGGHGGGHGGGGGGAEHIAAFKPIMKNWLIGHLAGKSLKEVSGTMGVKKLQREILEKFEEIMAAEQASHSHAPTSSSAHKVHLHLKEVLFEEYVVQ